MDDFEILDMVKNNVDKDYICMYFGISKRSLGRILSKYGLTKVGYGPNKLNYEIANEIRKLYENGCDQRFLARKYNVSQPTISKIINKQTYRSSGLKLTGDAEVRVRYRHGN